MFFNSLNVQMALTSLYKGSVLKVDADGEGRKWAARCCSMLDLRSKVGGELAYFDNYRLGACSFADSMTELHFSTIKTVVGQIKAKTGFVDQLLIEFEDGS